jgi:hypothetical protein
MSESEVARELLRELLQSALGGANGHGAPDPAAAARQSDPAAAPQVPAPPVAAVLRPSTWSQPPAPGEAIGWGEPAGASRDAAAGASRDAATELVAIDSDADLDRFVRALADRLEDAGARAAIRAGRLRFTLSRRGGASGGTTSAPAPGVMRIERGALTERTVEKAAKAGARLVLAPGAVPTPLAREKARALGIEIERE